MRSPLLSSSPSVSNSETLSKLESVLSDSMDARRLSSAIREDLPNGPSYKNSRIQRQNSIKLMMHQQRLDLDHGWKELGRT